jgi:hypothetical protein
MYLLKHRSALENHRPANFATSQKKPARTPMKVIAIFALVFQLMMFQSYLVKLRTQVQAFLMLLPRKHLVEIPFSGRRPAIRKTNLPTSVERVA